jgi:hypothetical protein
MLQSAVQAGHMHTPPTPAEAEAHLRRLLEESGMPQPDEVEHRPAELVLLYHEEKLAFTFELDDRWPELPETLER